MENSAQKRMFYSSKDGYVLGLVGILTPVLMALIIAILMVFIAKGAGEGYEELFNSPAFTYITQTLCELAFVFAVIIYNKKAKVEFKSASYMTTKPKYLNIAIALIVGVALPIFFNPIISMWEVLLKNIGVKVLDIGIPLDTTLDLVLGIVILGLVPAFCEELFFRGAVLNSFREKGFWFAVLYSAMCFSLMHGGLQQLPYTFILGFVIGTIVFETKSIWLGILVHACNNITVLVAGFLTKDVVPPESFSAADIIYAVLMLLVGIMLIVGTVIFCKKYNKPKTITLENPMKAEQKEKKMDVFAISMFVLTLICAVTITIIRGI